MSCFCDLVIHEIKKKDKAFSPLAWSCLLGKRFFCRNFCVPVFHCWGWFLPGFGQNVLRLTECFCYYIPFYWSYGVQIKIYMECKNSFRHFWTRKNIFNICWPNNQQLLILVPKNELKTPKNDCFLKWPEMQSANFFFSENVLLTQENNLDNLNVIIGTIDPFLQNQKNISKNFFQKFAQKWKTVNFLEKIKKSKKKKKFKFEIW